MDDYEGAELIIERFLDFAERKLFFKVVTNRQTIYPTEIVSCSGTQLARVARLCKQPQIMFLGCPDAYSYFSDLPFVHPPPNGYRDEWYVVDITPTTDLFFLFHALSVSHIQCDWMHSMSDIVSSIKEMAQMLIDNKSFKPLVSRKMYFSGIPDETDVDILPKILEIRRFLHSNEAKHLPDAAICHKVAKMVEYLEDDFVGETRTSTNVTYWSSMGNLRCYFSWRTKYRLGKTKSIPQGFCYLYICELLNGSGWRDPFKCQKELLNIYIGKESLISNDHLVKWIQDFSAYHRVPLDWDYEHTDWNVLLLQLTHPKYISARKLIPVISYLAKYKFETKKVCTEHQEDYQDILVRFFRILIEHDEDEKSSPKLLLVWHNTPWYELFFGVPVELDDDHGSYTYEIDEVHKYTFEGNCCTYSQCTMSNNFRSSLSDIMSTIELLLRKEFGLPKIKERLSPRNEYYKCIQKAIRDWKADKNKRVVVIDSSRLESVRQDAQKTSEKIRTSDEIDNVPDVKKDSKPKKEVKEKQAETEGSVVPETHPFLDKDEVRFMFLLIEGLNWQSYLKTIRVMPSVIVDSVNDKLFDEFGDTVLEMQDGKPVVIEDYKEDVKRILCL